MAEPTDTRVAVYIDFDNIVISRYNQLNGLNRFQTDRIRSFDSTASTANVDTKARLERSTVDVGAVLDFASSFGTIVLSRAYADWSAPANSQYQKQLIGRAVDLTQLFPTAMYTKNGADIRLAVDVVEDMFRLPDITHVVIVAGDSDYIALAQSCKRLGRYVVGIGVAGSTSRYLAAACNEFSDYDDLPGVDTVALTPTAPPVAKTPARARVKTETESDATAATAATAAAANAEPTAKDTQALNDAATDLLVRALRLGHAKNDDDEWLYGAFVKNQMKRIDPSFNEKSLGFKSFSDFIKSRKKVVELVENGQERRLKLRPEFATKS
jgi:uncharacterized LabA/DUF88 family protein